MTKAPTMRGEAVTLEWPERGIALATMTRADAMNTLSLELLDELGKVISLTRQERARALIITGSDRAFCCGAHLKYFEDPASPIGTTPEDIRDKYLWRIATLFDSLEELPFPTIAAINGYALGGGFEMALSCDFRIMSTSARVGLPEVVLGATPGAGGVQKLHRFVGRAKALEWILLGRHLSAAEVEPYGLLYAAADPGLLSYGVRKRVDLGRALALRPKVLIMDEPMAGMSTDEKGDLARFILDIRDARQIPIVLVEHDMEVVMDISDVVTVMDWGTVIASGTPAHIRKDPKVISAYLGQAKQ